VYEYGYYFETVETQDSVKCFFFTKGYFQLKAKPGVWFLNLREGRSKDIYNIAGYALILT
jgi:hypothetical protein